MNISHYLYHSRLNFLRAWSGIINRTRFSLHGIKLGKKSVFFGKVGLYKGKHSAITIGEGCVFRSHWHSNLIGINRFCSLSTLSRGAELSIGNNCGFSGTVIGCFSRITIGDDVKCGANTLITDSDWHPEDPRSGGSKPVFIGRNVWLGEGVKVMKGVTIGENSVIGAGSVVTRNIPANVIAAGNPCVVIKEIGFGMPEPANESSITQ